LGRRPLTPVNSTAIV